ncbi:MAG: response regulator [Cyclobacteriaceae bacterium]
MKRLSFKYSLLGIVMLAMQVVYCIPSGNSTTSDSNAKIDSLNKIGFNLIFSAPSKARSVFNSVLSMPEIDLYDVGKAQALKNKAISYDIQGSSNEAIRYYHEALSILEKISDTLGISRLKNNLGIAYKNLNHIETARRFYDESISLKSMLGDVKGVAYGYNNIGELYQKKKDYKEALVFFTKAFVILDSLEDDRGRSSTLSNLATSHLELEDYNLAIGFILRSIKIDKGLKDQFNLSNSYLLLATAHLYNNRIDDGLEAIQNAERTAGDIGALKVYYESMVVKARLLRRKNRIEELPDLYEKILILKDSLAHLNLIEETAKVQGLYESHKNEIIIEDLKKESKMNRVLLKSQNRLFAISIFAIFSLTGMLIIVFILYKKGQSKKRELEVKIQERNLARQEAEVASQAKSQFLTNMSHEIRTPLNAIIGYTDQVLEASLEESVRDYMKIVSQSSHVLLGLVNEILDISKLESGKLELNIESTDLVKLCEQVISLTSYNAINKNLSLRLTPVEDKYRYVFVDSMRLKQVLINLLANAVKFTEQGEIELKVKAFEEEEKGEIKFCFSVRDTGTGIRKENQEKIFQAFSQEDSSTTRKYGGTGLGLSISNDLLSLMGSKLELISVFGEGSTFSFDLICKVSDLDKGDAFRQNPINNSSKIISESKDLVVLIAEDNPMNLILSKLLVKKALPNAQIVQAVNGREAVDRFVSEKPDIVFMDVQMPELDGYRATAEMRKTETTKRTPIIALTAGSMKVEMERCFEAGMDDFVSKPIVNNAISRVIERWNSSVNGTEVR